MNRLRIGNRVLPIFSLLSVLLVNACQDAPAQFSLSAPGEDYAAMVNAADKEAGEKSIRDLLEERDEFRKTEFFDEKHESVRFFLGQFANYPDPVFDPKQPLRSPNQEEVESLFKYMRKYLDSLEAGGPDPEIIKRKLFIDENGKLHFNKLLDKFRFLPEFRDVSFSIEGLTFNRAKGVPGIKPVRYTSIFKNIVAKDVKFDSVKLEDVDFSGSTLNNVTIADTNFSRALCMRCRFENVNINDSTSKDADFSFSSGDMTFNNSNTSYLKFTDANLDSLKFNDGSLRHSVFINSGEVGISGVAVLDNIFDNTRQSRSFRSIGLVYKNSFPGGTAYKILNKIRSADHLPVRIEYGLEKYVDENALQAEVVNLLSNLGTSASEGSIAQNFISAYRAKKDDYPEIAKMDRMTSGYVAKLDGLIIPGGLDVEPYWFDRSISADRFYTDVRARLKGKKNIEAEKFPIRSILELFLIDHALNKQIPMMLVCRGAHIYNIYKNGRMIENLPDIYDNVDFENHLRYVAEAPSLSEEDRRHRIYELFAKAGGKAAVYGNHHQAIDPAKAGDGLRTILVWNLPGKTYVPYALYDNTYKAGAWLFQFHPEVKEEMGAAMSRQLSNLNSEAFDSFFDLVAGLDKRVISTKPIKVEEPVAEEPSLQPTKTEGEQPIAVQPDERPPTTGEPTIITPDTQGQAPAAVDTPPSRPIDGAQLGEAMPPSKGAPGYTHFPLPSWTRYPRYFGVYPRTWLVY